MNGGAGTLVEVLETSARAELTQGQVRGAEGAEQLQLAEVSRQFYVGVTRAKSQVHLMFNQRESPLLTKVRAAVAL